MSSDDRLIALGLGHLVGDPDALAAELERRSQTLRARQATWDAEQEKWLAEQKEKSDQEAVGTAMRRKETVKPVVKEAAVPSLTFLGPTDRARTLDAPNDLESIRSSWDYLKEVCPWPTDLDADMSAKLMTLHQQTSDVMAFLSLTGTQGARDRLQATTQALRQTIGARRLRTESAVAMLLSIADAILSGGLLRK